MGMGNGRAPDDGAARPMRAVAATLATPGQPRAHLDGLRLAQALDLGAQAAAFVLQRGDAALVCIVRGGVCRLGGEAPRDQCSRRLRALPVEPLAGNPHGADVTDGPPAVGARVRDGGARPRLPERLLRLGHGFAPASSPARAAYPARST